jgi:hypothetical protein
MSTLKLKRTRWSRMHAPSSFIVIAICLLAGPVYATPPFGFSSQTFRGRIAGNVGAHQWNPGPLFTLLIQSSGDQWGTDVVQGTTEFAPMDAMGRPSQSGWHDHPTTLSIGLVIQGTVWSHAAGTNCLQPIPTGSVFFERSGEIHNNYNLDPRTAAVVRIIHFVDRNQSATRRDQPDPVTGNPTTAAPPPAPCPADNSPANSHGFPARAAADPRGVTEPAVLTTTGGQIWTAPFSFIAPAAFLPAAKSNTPAGAKPHTKNRRLNWRP